MYSINSLDIETYNDFDGKVLPICVCSLVDNNFITSYFSENEDIVIENLEKIFYTIKKETIIYIHNINFDGSLILTSLSKQNKFKFNTLIRNNDIYYIKIFFELKIITFKCSYKIVPLPLKQIAKSFNLGEKKIFPHKFSSKENFFYIGKKPKEHYFDSYDDYLNYKIYKFDFKEEIIKYCTNDLIITSKFVEEIKKLVSNYKLNLDNIYSAPSLSIKIYDKNYNKNKLSLNIKTDIKECLKSSYFGGRCEVYGNPFEFEKIFHYDFRGMYAQCMLENFPHGEIYTLDKPKDFKIPGFYLIEYDSNMYLPVLPHKSLIKEKLMFTNGKSKGLFWFEEINLFVEMGGIVENIEFAILYSKFDKIFENFTEEFTELRKKNEIFNIFGKLIINSLYGRMGMGDIEEEDIIINKEEFFKIDEKDIKKISVLNDYIFVTLKRKKKKKVKNNIGIAASITSKARIKLYKAQQDVLINNGRILYSDTDSIYASFLEDVSEKKHGVVDWSIDKKKIKDCVFISSKTYAIKYENNEESVKIKGFDNKNFNFADLKNKFYNKEEYIESNNNRFISRKNMEMFNIENIKKLNLKNYDKRKFCENLKETKPLTRCDHLIYL